MSAFVIAAVAMLAGVVPCGIVMCRGRAMEALVAYETISSIVVMALALLAEGFRRFDEFEFPILMGLLLFGSGVVFLRALERWL